MMVESEESLAHPVQLEKNEQSMAIDLELYPIWSESRLQPIIFKTEPKMEETLECPNTVIIYN